MTKIYRFNDNGLKAFNSFIEQTRDFESRGNPKMPLPPLVTDSSLTEVVSKKSSIDSSKKFSNRYEMAEYLTSEWKDFSNVQYEDIGAWSWLAALYFDQLRGPKTQRSEQFIPDIYNPKTPGQDLTYRHSVYFPFYLKKEYEDPFCKLILMRKTAEFAGDPLEQCCSRGSVLSSATIRKLVCQLYQDKSTGRTKPGSFDPPSDSRVKKKVGYGGARRLIPVIIPRLKKSFDVQNMSVKDIISVGGKEITTSKWIK